MSVAVSESPDGPFEYLSDIKYKNGAPVWRISYKRPRSHKRQRQNMALLRMGARQNFRSKVFFSALPLCAQQTDQPLVSRGDGNKTKHALSCAVVELENDMCTVRRGRRRQFSTARLQRINRASFITPFYEAPCIRKINDLYYLIYSSGENNSELAYATKQFSGQRFSISRRYYFKQRPRLSRQQAAKAPAGTIRLDRTDKRKILCFLSPLHEQYGFLPPDLRGARNNKRRRNNKSG